MQNGLIAMSASVFSVAAFILFGCQVAEVSAMSGHVAAYGPEIKHVKLTAKGKAFCIRAELSEFGSSTDPLIAHEIHMKTRPALHITRCADRLHVHIQGACIGVELEPDEFASLVLELVRNTYFNGQRIRLDGAIRMPPK